MTDEAVEALKPCPFCGGNPELADIRLSFVVRCKSCGGAKVQKWHGEFDDDGHREATDADVEAWRAEAITAWNTRAYEANCTDVEELREALELHDAFALSLLRAMCLGIELNANVRGFTKESAEAAEKAFVPALAEDREALLARISSLEKKGS